MSSKKKLCVDSKIIYEEQSYISNLKHKFKIENYFFKIHQKDLDEYEKISSYLKRWSIYRNRYLNLVMKQMLLMGGSRIGAKRAFLFALENKLDISFPLKYGLDSSDPNERYFINEFLNAGGDPDLVCYINYMTDSKPTPETIRRRLKYRNTLGKIPYTNEEKQLHSRLVLALTRHPNYKS